MKRNRTIIIAVIVCFASAFTYLALRWHDSTNTPANYATPLSHHQIEDTKETLLTLLSEQNPKAGLVPTIYSTMPGYEVVWHQKPGQKGNGIAALYRGSETATAQPEVAVLFLTPEQLLLLHSTESVYDLGYVGEVTLETGQYNPCAYLCWQ